MAAAEKTAESVKGLGVTIQNLAITNAAGFSGIESSLRKEFKGQNKLLGGYLGKNLQRIADAITGSNDDLIKQMQDDARKMAEQLAEAMRKDKGAGDDTGAPKDLSLDMSIAGILAGLVAFLIGFVKGYIAELKLIVKSVKATFTALGKDAKALWNLGKSFLKNSQLFKWYESLKAWFNKKITFGWQSIKNMIFRSKVAIWYRNLKSWFAAKAWDAKFKWATFKDLVKNSKLVGWFNSVKGWFKTKIGWALIDLKASWKTSTIATLITRLKTWFATPIGATLGNVKAWFQGGGISTFITKVKTIAGKSAFLEELGKGVTRIKNMFTAGGPGLFAKLSTWIKSFKIPFPAWVTDIIAKARALVGKGSFLGGLGSFFGRLFVWFQIITAVFDFWGGWTETQGTLWDKLWGGLSAALKGFINAFLDLGIMIEDGIKWIITKIGGFFGFDEKEIEAAIGEFSIFKPIKEAFNTIIDWVVTLMTDPLAAFGQLWEGAQSVGAWIYDMAIKPVWDWFKGFWPGGAEYIESLFGDIASLGAYIYDNAIKPVWDWIAGVFGFGDEDKKEDSRSFFQILGDAISGIWTWFKGLFTFDDTDKPAADAKGILGYLTDMVTGVWTWFKGLFSWGAEKKPAADADTTSGVLGFLTGLVTGIWTWFKGLFDFSTVGKAFASVLNVIFLPYTILLGLVQGIWTWFKGLFGFDTKETETAGAETKPGGIGGILLGLVTGVWKWFKDIFTFSGKVEGKEEFSIVKMLGDLIDDIWAFMKDLVDIDVMSIAKNIPGASTLLGWMGIGGGDKKEEEKAKPDPISSLTPQVAYEKGLKEGAEKSPTAPIIELPDFGAILDSKVDWGLFDFGTWFMGKLDLNLGTKMKGMMTSVLGMQEGGLVGMSSFPTGSIGDAFGLESGGLFTLSAGEFVLDNQAAQTFLMAAKMLSGQELAGLQREANGLSGAGAPIVIQDNSVTSTQQGPSLVLPNEPVHAGNPENGNLAL